MKHEWRKQEKSIYMPKTMPGIVNIPAYKFITIEGAGNPNSDHFAEYVSVLYPISYAVKMIPKKQNAKPAGYYDYTVYPLEGVWDINEEAKKTFDGTINKDDLVFKLMIRQPSFLDDTLFNEMLEVTKAKKPHTLLDKIKFETFTEGKCVQMLHIGPYDNETESFKVMEDFTQNENLLRVSKVHREIYLSDFRKVAPAKLKTVLRFQVTSNE